MAITSSSKTKIAIGTQAAASDATTYQADTYTVVGKSRSISAFGESYEEITFVSLGDGEKEKLAGVRDSGDITIELGYDASDAGQVALVAAMAANYGLPFNFRIELNNALASGAGPHHGEYLFFKGVVMGRSFEPGSEKDVVISKIKVSLTSAVTTVAAA